MTVRWVRSMPNPLPPNRAYVADTLPKFYHTNYDYTKLVPYNDDARLVLIEWDVAIGLREMERINAWGDIYGADSVVGAGVLHYDDAGDHYVQRQLIFGDTILCWVNPGEPQCDWTGFDLISFPQGILRECYNWLLTLKPTHDQRLTDNTFSWWMHDIRKQPIVIDWRIHTTHLHYAPPCPDTCP